MSIDDLTGTSHQAWDLESEFADWPAHAIDSGVVLARIALRYGGRSD